MHEEINNEPAGNAAHGKHHHPSAHTNPQPCVFSALPIPPQLTRECAGIKGRGLLVPNIHCPSHMSYRSFETARGQICSGHETLEANSEKVSILVMKTKSRLKHDSCSRRPTDTVKF